MSEEVTPAEVPATPAPAAQPETDWKAEARKWEQRAKENRAEIDAAKSAAEAAQQAAEATFAEQLKAAEDKANAEALRASRFQIAAAKGVDPELLSGGTAEELEAYADKLAAFIESRTTSKTVVPGLGSTPPAPPSVDEQIRAAEASGDVNASLALKMAKLSQLQA